MLLQQLVDVKQRVERLCLRVNLSAGVGAMLIMGVCGRSG
jgi:hypothetical protein